MKISRFPLFLIGFAVILCLYFAQRYSTYRNSGFTHGVMFCEHPFDEHFYEEEMILYYYIGEKEYAVPVLGAVKDANRCVDVRYPKNKPGRGRVYTFSDFWIVSALWLLLPLMLWGAFVFTLLEEEGRLVVTWMSGKRKARDAENQKQNILEG